MLAVTASLLATATIWLLLTQPTRVADAMDRGTVTPLVGELAKAVTDACWQLLKWLV